MKTTLTISIVMTLSSVSMAAFAGNELASMDLEQLMDMNVTTVSKRVQTFSSAAAAIYTITQEDIRRAGATNLPEVLLQSPGIEVARVNPGMWAVTARGFNGHGANKLLVLIDGRSIYTSVSAGVYWDQQMPSLDDIQRIEIIRGPGASLWGSNAVNGVINIITYDSEQTLGTRATAGIGNEEKGYARTRYGFRDGNLTGRVNAQFRKVDEAVRVSDGKPSNDDYGVYQIGSRLDWNPLVTDKVTFDTGYTETNRHTEAYVPESLAPLMIDPPPSVQAKYTGALYDSLSAKNLYAMWNWLHQLKNGDGFFFQMFVDAERRIDPLYQTRRNTTEFEFQYNIVPTDEHRWTWGLSHRNTEDEVDGTFMVYSEDSPAQYSTFTGFLQDEYQFAESWVATVGVKLEESTYADLEHQPSLRLAWQPTNSVTWWVSAARATRSPSRFESSYELRVEPPIGFIEGARAINPDLVLYQIYQGNDNVKSEILYAYETGIRFQLHDDVLIDLTTYKFHYKKLSSLVLDENLLHIRWFDPIYPYIGGVTYAANTSRANAEGVELALHYSPSENWQMKGGYTYFNLVPANNEFPYPRTIDAIKFQAPQNQAYVSSFFKLPAQWELGMTVRYCDEISRGDIPAYTAFDMRIAKSLSRHFDIALIGKDLFDGQRMEIMNRVNGPIPTEMERSIYLQLSWY